MAQQKRIQLRTVSLQVRSLASLIGLRIRCCRGAGCRCGSDPVLLGLWCRLWATALIRPLAWETPYALGAALKRQKDIKKKLKTAICSSHQDSAVTKPTSMHEETGSTPGLAQWIEDPALLWLQCRSQTWLRSDVAVAMA